MIDNNISRNHVVIVVTLATFAIVLSFSVFYSKSSSLRITLTSDDIEKLESLSRIEFKSRTEGLITRSAVGVSDKSRVHKEDKIHSNLSRVHEEDNIDAKIKAIGLLSLSTSKESRRSSKNEMHSYTTAEPDILNKEKTIRCEYNISNKSSISTTTGAKKPRCSLAAFSSIAANHETGYIPANGIWTTTATNEIIQFKPTVCQYEYNLAWPVKKVSDCFYKENINYIVVLGDSNGLFYSKALLEHLNAHEYECTLVKSSLNASYYQSDSINITDIHLSTRHCRRCANSLTKCTTNVSRNGAETKHMIYVEYLVMEYTLDAELTTWHDVRKCTLGTLCTLSRSSQEFLFREYLRGEVTQGLRGPPDLVLVFGSSHDKNQLTLNDFRRDLRYTMDLAEDLLPTSTRIVWFTKPYESVEHKPRRWQNVKYENAFEINEWLRLSNQILFTELKKQATRSKRMFPFFDLLCLGESINDLIAKDGVHMQPFWYRHIISYFLQSICVKYF